MDKLLLRNAALHYPQDVLPPYDALLGLEGFDAIYALTEHLGGLTVYVPHARSIFIKCLEQEIRREFNGSNFIKLAKKYGFTERHIRRMVGHS